MADDKRKMAGSQHRLLITLNRIVAVLSVLAAILLYTGGKKLGVPGLAGAPHHEPLIVHCLLTALLLFGANTELRRSRDAASPSIFRYFGELFLLAFAGVDLGLAGSVLVRFDIATVAALLLAIPAIQCGWSFFALQVRVGEEKEQSEESSTAGDKNDRNGGAQEHYDQEEIPPLGAAARYALVYALLMGAFYYLFVPGYVYFNFLEDAVFEQEFRGWVHFLGWLTAAVLSTFPLFLAFAGVIFFAVFGIVALAVRRRRRDQHIQDTLKRDFTQIEQEGIESAFEKIQAYAERIQQRTRYDVVGLVAWLAVGGLVTGWIFLAAGGRGGLGTAFFERIRTEGLEWYLYIDWAGGGDALTFLSIILLGVFLWAFLVRVWPEFGAHAGLEHHKRDNDALNPWGYYRGALIRDVRSGALDLDAEFEPGTYIRSDYMRFLRICYIIAVPVFAVNLFFLYLDRMDYDLLTEGYIETTDYWTSKVHSLSYADVDRVEVACAFKGGDEALSLSYELKVREGRTIPAIDLDTPKKFRRRLPGRLDAWIRVDAQLRDAGVPVRHAVRKMKGGRKSAFDERECIAGLNRLVGPDLRARVLPLLQETEGGHLVGGRNAEG